MPRAKTRIPKHYTAIRKRYPALGAALEQVGTAAREAGPLDNKTGHLIQLAAAAAVHSEGSVRSHARRALAAGATPEEIRHALVLLTSTIGFPTVAAALSWVEVVLVRK